MIDIISILLAVTATGAVAAALSEFVQRYFRKKREEETIEQRIERLSTSLSEAVGLINQIEEEITSRQALVDKLRSDIETYNNLVSLKQTEVEAVAQVLRRELRTEGRHFFWRGVAVNFLFFVLGAVASFVLVKLYG